MGKRLIFCKTCHKRIVKFTQVSNISVKIYCRCFLNIPKNRKKTIWGEIKV